MSENHLFCFGLGYSALTLSKKLLSEGWRISGTCRTASKCDSLMQYGITSEIFTEDIELLNHRDLLSATHILLSIPPQENGDIIFNRYKDLLLKSDNLKWIGYLSTTGVYGNHDGAWVTEDTPVSPPNERSKRRVVAEKNWLSLKQTHIFRLSGIYGDERSTLTALKNGTAHRIEKKGQVFSRINVEDIALMLKASIIKPTPGEIYNGADDYPCAQREVVEYVAQKYNLSLPELVSIEGASISKMAKSFYKNNRRVSNKKVKEILSFNFTYPTFKYYY